MEFFFFLFPFGSLDEATWAYEGWGLGQSGSRRPETKEEGSGYFLSWNALASHESGNLSA